MQPENAGPSSSGGAQQPKPDGVSGLVLPSGLPVPTARGLRVPLRAALAHVAIFGATYVSNQQIVRADLQGKIEALSQKISSMQYDRGTLRDEIMNHLHAQSREIAELKGQVKFLESSVRRSME